MGKRKKSASDNSQEEIIETTEQETTEQETTEEETTEQEENVEESSIVIGKVSNCEKLNVREKASSSSRVVSVLDKDDEIEVVVNESTDDYYKVNIVKFRCTGYCDKNYITLI